jgi:hypothetical protein
MIDEVRYRLRGLAGLVVALIKKARRRTGLVVAQWEARGREWAAR